MAQWTENTNKTDFYSIKANTEFSVKKDGK